MKRENKSKKVADGIEKEKEKIEKRSELYQTQENLSKNIRQKPHSQWPRSIFAQKPRKIHIESLQPRKIQPQIEEEQKMRTFSQI